MRHVLLLIGLACLSGFSLRATSVPVNFDFAELPPNSTQESLPYLLNGTNDTLFLKFLIPDIDLIETINSITVNVTLYDNGDHGGETGRIQFALPSTNIDLASFTTNLNGTTQSSPETFTDSLSPNEIAEVFPSIEDGNLRIKVQRDTGDFFVAGGTVIIDATLVPEPASLLSAIGGLVAIGVWRRRRSTTRGPR
jgi:hypothetical protein